MIRHFTIVDSEGLLMIQLRDEGLAKQFEKFIREQYPSTGLASFDTSTPDTIYRTEEEKERVSSLMEDFALWNWKGEDNLAEQQEKMEWS